MGTYLNRRHTDRRHRNGRSLGPTYAALDLGTNNCRLLVARPTDEGGFRVVDAFSRIVRLGEGLSRDGKLAEPAMERTIEALAVCASKIRRARVVRTRNVATEACRRARNCVAFLDEVARRTGLVIETISSREEIRLVLQGCAPLLKADPDYALVFDIGGGSTEIIWVQLGAGRPEVIDYLSMPVGVVNLSERFGYGEISEVAYRGLVDEVDRLLAPFCFHNEIAQAVSRGIVQMLGTSGTVTTLAGVRLDLPRYNRSVVDGSYLGFEAIAMISKRLRRLDRAGRAGNACIGAERAELVVAGCAILEAICKRWPVGRLRVADRGIREGILNEFMASFRTAPNLFGTPEASSIGHGAS